MMTQARKTLLSRQELKVLHALTEGLTDQLVIARSLRMTESDVQLHITSLLIKMNAHSRTEAAIKAIKAGIFRRCVRSG